MSDQKPRFVAVHVGAGHHSAEKTDAYKNVCKISCLHAIGSKTPVDVVADAVTWLENSPITNAGTGSNLTETGTVECDAGVIDGSNVRYGAVGAVKGIKNPVLVARVLLHKQLCGIEASGRIPPSFLVGDSAYAWAAKNKLPVVGEDFLITKSALRMQQKCYKKVFQSEPKRRYLEEVFNVYDDMSDVSDTVGAICVDEDGSVACASSSGGLLLKQPGRIGPAAMMGCGFWAERVRHDAKSVAVCTSGCGESLMRTFFAKSCAEAVRDADCPSLALERFFQTSVVKSSMFLSRSERMIGALVVIYDVQSKTGDVLWAHTTDSMCVGVHFVTSESKKRTIKMSRNGSNCGELSVVVEGMPFRL